MKKIAVLTTLIIALGLVIAGCAPAPPECPACPEGGECPSCPDCPAGPDCPDCPEVGPTSDLGGREIVIAEENSYPPFNYIDKDTDEWIGWDYDVMREVCERLNCTPVFVEAAWEGMFEAMAAGEYDMAFDGITLTVPRSMVVDYGDPYIEYGQVILVRADDERPALADEEGLVASDLTIGVQIATTNEITAMKLVGEARILSFAEYDMPVTALMVGDVDTVIIDEVAAIGFMGENPGEMRIAFAVTSGEVLAPIFPPLSPLVEPVNWAVQEMFADGTMDEICVKWLLRPCTPE